MTIAVEIAGLQLVFFYGISIAGRIFHQQNVKTFKKNYIVHQQSIYSFNLQEVGRLPARIPQLT
jgi:hypothetical protein